MLSLASSRNGPRASDRLLNDIHAAGRQTVIFMLLNKLTLSTKVHCRLIWQSHVKIIQNPEHNPVQVALTDFFISFKRGIFFKNSAQGLIICSLMDVSGELQAQLQRDVPSSSGRDAGCAAPVKWQSLFSPEENWMICSGLCDLGRKFPWLLVGRVRGCSGIPCTQGSFQRTVHVSPFTGGWSQRTLREQGWLRNSAFFLWERVYRTLSLFRSVLTVSEWKKKTKRKKKWVCSFDREIW